MPAVQLGFSFYASVATVMAIAVLIRTFPSFSATPLRTYVLLGLVAAMLVASGTLLPGATDADTLRRAREAFFFVLLSAGLIGSLRYPPKVRPEIIYVTLSVSALFAVLAVIQNSTLANGRYFGIPPTFFIQNAETLPGLLDLRYSRIRPTGTFGEPSYFAFILLSILTMITPLLRQAFIRLGRPRLRRTKRLTRYHWFAGLTAVFLCISGALSQSLAFYLAFPALLYFGVGRYGSVRARFWLTVSAAVAVPVLLGGMLSAVIISRLSGESVDTSLAARILVPLQILPQYLFQNPLGSPDSLLVPNLSEFTRPLGLDGSEVIHNALLNMFFRFGILGFACAFVYLRIGRDAFVWLYLVTCLMFNGAVFAVDKYAVIMATVAIYGGLLRFHNVQGPGGSIGDHTVEFGRS